MTRLSERVVFTPVISSYHPRASPIIIYRAIVGGGGGGGG